MYGEYFDIPQPDELVFISSFAGGEVFRSGCCFRRGKGRVFYFSPGHETYPVYRQAEVRRVIANGVVWAHDGEPSPLDTSSSIESPAGWFEVDRLGLEPGWIGSRRWQPLSPSSRSASGSGVAAGPS